MSFPFLSQRKESPRLQLLRSLSLLSDLSRRELRVVDGLMHDRQYLKGEIVFDQGDEGQALYVILSGRVAIVQLEGVQREAPLALPLILESGQFFGELALLDNSPRMAQARAAEDCMMAVLFREEFTELLETHAVIASKIAIRLARELGVRLRSAMLGRGQGDAL